MDSTFCLHVTKQDGYFLTACQGKASLSRILSGWSGLAERCIEEGINKIICQPHVPGPAEFLDVYQFGISFRDISWPPGTKIAIVCPEDDLPQYRIAEMMVENLRGPESRIFTSIEDARGWLLDRPQRNTRTNAQ
ncbi:MAG TPA: hypothetical protein VI078_16250 [bacterium]